MIEPCFSGICQCKSNWKSRHDFNCMTLNPNLNTAQFEPLPLYMNSDKVLENVGHGSYEFGGWIKRDVMMIKHQGPFGKLSAVSHDQSPILATNLYLTEQQYTPATEVDCRLGAHSSQGRNLFIFDKTGDETRLILSSLVSPALRNQTDLASLRIPKPQTCGEENLDARLVQCHTEAPILCQKSNENHTVDNDEGTDYHEDTDEINALLYSDSEDYNDANRDVEDEDEVSTGHSPLGVEEVGFENGDDVEEDDDANSLDIFPKRQKLLDCSFIKSSTSVGSQRAEMPPPRLLMLHEKESVVDSSTSNLDNTTRGPISGIKRSRNEKDKILQHTLKVLEKLVPGPTTTTRRRRRKDPVMIIDQAIEYLKYLKVKAESQSLLLDDPESSSFFRAQ